MSWDSQGLEILLIEDNLEESELIQEMLEEVFETPWRCRTVTHLSEGLQSLKEERFDIVLLDLWLPDSTELNGLLRLREQFPTIPIVVLSSLNNRELAIDAIRQGAQDYLLKGRFDGELLIRVINYGIERQRIAEELRQQVEREKLMGRIIERIRQSLDLQEIIQTTVTEVRHLLKTDRVLIYRCQSDVPGMIVSQSIDPKSEGLNPADFQGQLNLVQKFLLNPQGEHHSSQEDFERLERLLQSQIDAVLTVPIWESRPQQRNNNLWGQLIAQNYRGSRPWQPWEIDFLRQLGNQVAIAIKQSELYQEVEKLATLDGLTNIANRRQFNKVLQQEWLRLAREGKPLSIIIADVDFFKNYNSAYGHVQGDVCLQQVALALTRACHRPADLVARYGGEEFAMILPDTDVEGGLTVAQNIGDNLETMKLPHKASLLSPYVTMSVGIATEIPLVDREPFTLVERADKALLQAKAQGRNKIVQG